MTANKKTILISWFIGLGSGLFIAGIILSVLLYSSNKIEPMPEVTHKQEEREPEEVKEQESIKNKKKTIQDKTVVDPVETSEFSESIELEIGPAATAREITMMLLDNGIISDYGEFIAYIVSQDAERVLSHGRMTFPLNSDIETIFKILRP